MYGVGLRLRVQDIDFACNEITVRDSKGGKDRITMLPESLKRLLQSSGICARSKRFTKEICPMPSICLRPDTIKVNAILMPIVP